MSLPDGFSLIPLPDGRRELRAPASDGSGLISLVLDEHDGRALAVAVADVLTALDSPEEDTPVHDLILDGRRVTVSGKRGSGLKVQVERRI